VAGSPKLVGRCYERAKKKAFSGEVENEKAVKKLIEKGVLSLIRTNSKDICPP